ncbi:peptide deformylase [Tepidibacillus infernus]|uniref:Peptide deformylase n=1 Tax=Tepidibacillus decaturensis TaxID=1413211 RepID=A0A135L462_9BACI|nr:MULTISPECIES: peptide deformylase [Tepidibacillus]KXG43720.1 peptide deformylase [Tepidibacillus decaturensis]GBF12186.1 peptide deformylase 1 [Tepidibacillus sp. HK-1]
MAIRVILKDTDPLLRQISKPVEEITPRIHKLLDDMAETMYDAEGVGLAAPQIAILKRVIVIDIGEGLIELINPEIIEKDGVQIGPEGCLSVPGVVGKVSRAEHVKVKALDRNGKERIYEGHGLLARAFQHEIDHLNGILFTDLAEEYYKEDLNL